MGLVTSRVADADADADLDRAHAALRAYDTTALGTSGPAGPHVAGVFICPERTGDGIRLVTAILRDSRKHREILADPRVAFMCSPGNPSTWIQGAGRAEAVEETSARDGLFARLLAHAPGARPFVENLVVLPMTVTVTRIKVVWSPQEPALSLDLSGEGA